MTAIMRTTGLDLVAKRISTIKKIPVVSIRIQCNPTAGVIRRKTKPDYVDSRSAGKNVIIFRTQEKRGRKVSYLSRKERSTLDTEWAKATKKIVRVRGDATPFLLGAGERIGPLFIKYIQEHIRRGKALRGRVRPVTRGTKEAKKRSGTDPTQYGLSELPPLIFTGMLYSSLTYRVRTSI